MNQGNFPNMGGARPPQQPNQHVGGMQRNGGTSSDIQLHILNILQGEPVPPGWQQIVPPKQRAAIIHQMVTGLQIVKPDMNVQYAVGVATGFEMQQFAIAPDKESYDRSWRHKLQEIQATRQSQANMQQQQFQNQQAAQMGLTQQQMQARGMMGNQNQFQPGFAMPQPPQPGQAMGVPMQHQLSQNQRLVQNGNPTEVQHMQHPLQNNQPMQNIPRPGLPNRGQQQFTPEENHQINNMARQMLAKLTNEDRVNLHRKLATTLPAAQQQALQAQGYDPVAAYIRNQASHAFANDRQKVLQANGQGAPPPANGAMSAPGRPMSQVSMRAQQQPHPPPTTQQPEHSFGMGNLDQFLGQQQEGLRHQAAGQDVVPASNGQAAAPQMRGTPHQPLQGQFAPNRPMQPPSFPSQPQPQWNGPQNQQPNAHQTARMPMQPATPNFAAMQGQTPHQQPLQGQLGGLSNNNAQRTPQQNPNMPTLNQPMDPPNQAQNVLNQRPSQPTPKQGQQNRLSGQPAAAENTKPNQTQQGQGGGNLPPQFAKLPPKLQQELQRIPVDKRRQFLLNLQNNSQRQKMKAAAEAQNSGNAPNVAQRGAQGPAMGATANQATEPSQASNPQATSTANYSGPQAGGNPFAQTNMMHSQGSQQGPDPSRPMPPRMMPIQLNEVQLRFMDSQPFPPAILNKNNSLGQLPESVKTWRQLKDYVQQRGQSLPPGSINNVVGLQSIHMQQIQNSTANKTRMHQLQVMAQGGMKPGLTGQAPQAPSMIPQQSSQPQLPGTVPPGQFPMPHLPQPTMQEIHAARATLPDNVKGISDNQLRGMIFQRRQQEFLKANQQILNPQQQRMIQRNNILQAQRMNSQQGQLPVGQNQTGQLQQAPRGQPQMPQPAPQQVLPPQAPKQPTEPQGRQSQPNRPNQIPPATQKGNKPITNDDVVEVPDPKTQQQPRSSNMRPGQTPQITQEAFARLPNEQKAQFQARIQEAQMNQRAKLGMASQMSSTQPPAASANQNTGLNAGQGNLRDPAMEALMHEVARNTPRRPIVPMSPKTRHQMVEKLKDKTANLVQRIEQTLPVFLRISKNVDQAKEVLRMRLILLRQVHESAFNKPNENFTLSIQELDEYKNKLNQHVVSVLRSVQSNPAAAASHLPPGQPQQLNAANLQQQQALFNAARAASAQKNQTSGSSRAPAAPTASHPPFAFGSQSPQGVPQYNAGKNELTQEQLKLPQAKKRKPNQAPSAASTPAQTMNTPVTKSSPIAKVESPEIQRIPAVPNMMKCNVLDCETEKKGFVTKEELEKHRTEVHEPKEPAIKDPLDAAAYAIESLRIALNLDENGRSKPVATLKDDKAPPKEDKGSFQAPAMKASASSQSQTVKQEVATPMSRNQTQMGPSPSSNLLRTPQATTTGKTPASDVKPTAKATGTKGPAAKFGSVTEPDPWANSHVKPEWFKEVFSDVADLNRAVPDEFIADWLERNPFTPPTSSSSGALDKDSPHKSDISANDNLNINVMAGVDDWLPSEWFDDGLRGDMEALDVGDLMEMDWDTAFVKHEEETLGKGKRRRDPMDPSDEWLKAWAPEKCEENKKRDAERKR